MTKKTVPIIRAIPPTTPSTIPAISAPEIVCGSCHIECPRASAVGRSTSESESVISDIVGVKWEKVEVDVYICRRCQEVLSAIARRRDGGTVG